MIIFIEYFCLIVININFNNTITFEGEAKKKEKGLVEEKTVEKEGQEGKKGTEKEKSPKDKTVEDVFPKTTNVEEGQEGKKEPEKEKIPKEKTVEDESTKTTDPKAQIAPDFVQIEDETHLLDQDDDKVSTKLSEETAPSSQKSDQSTKMKTRYKMVARKNKNKSPVVVPSGRITRSQGNHNTFLFHNKYYTFKYTNINFFKNNRCSVR
ncbi:uncharacterized protein LOC110681708 [Chenopodium quinoa]|uniref:uncharacterized protein LOC110681708 n=1 Tax=Chenopodium quinoa TaxID=63459 RepID=UPI000B77C3FE|nr:uncharacterized protein LOC110681708 [Chenopodium quinoa]XP_021713532.1 uncharacterized protein LOC110681708 [Chenopodium quinoa]